ncbi:hypothetical protein [Flavisphingomonas formosensis]|uniref:hypothetical protein n=1 Tax=Flavisphingomonas formosensis TaxID=861534 RepID=UPI0012FA81BB|nr:hypothetical protein [Sphingomonas formosensis]
MKSGIAFILLFAGLCIGESASACARRPPAWEMRDYSARSAVIVLGKFTGIVKDTGFADSSVQGIIKTIRVLKGIRQRSYSVSSSNGPFYCSGISGAGFSDGSIKDFKAIYYISENGDGTYSIYTKDSDYEQKRPSVDDLFNSDVKAFKKAQGLQ